MPGIAMEVHHAAASEVDVMISKKQWAEGLLQQECPDLEILYWRWIIPNGRDLLFTQSDPAARRLAAFGIDFPTRRLAVPSLP
jgi:hypothetical protein